MIGLKIENDIVINAAVFDKIPPGWVAAPNGVGIGWVYNGDGTFSAPLKPESTQEELLDQNKYDGVEFSGVMCSATAEDMWGLNSVESWVASGQTVNFKFQNGNMLTLTAENMGAFKAVWIPFRASFF